MSFSHIFRIYMKNDQKIKHCLHHCPFFKNYECTMYFVYFQEDFEDEDEDLEEDFEERQESLDSDEPEEEDVTKRKVVKRKRKSYRNEQDQDEENDSDSDDSLIRNRRMASRKEKVSISKEVVKEEQLALEDNPEDDELPKELLFTNIYTGNSRNFEARYCKFTEI